MKAIDKLQQEHDNLVKSYEEIGRKLQQQAKELAELKKERTSERIRVPEEIKFEMYGSLLLVSPNGLCLLTASEAHGGIPYVIMAGNYENPSADLYTGPLYLDPVNQKDLKCRDIVVVLYGEDDIEKAKYSILNYSVVLNPDTLASWRCNMDVECMVAEADHYYKVVEK